MLLKLLYYFIYLPYGTYFIKVIINLIYPNQCRVFQSKGGLKTPKTVVKKKYTIIKAHIIDKVIMQNLLIVFLPLF